MSSNTIVKIIGFESYLADSDGYIIGPKGHRLKPWLRPDGYEQVGVRRCDKRITASVHRLMGVAFLGLDFDDSGTDVDHKNDIRNINRLSNLQLLKRSQNIAKSWSDKWTKDTDELKVCRCCELVQPRVAFGKDKSSNDLLYHYCKSCSRLLQYGSTVNRIRSEFRLKSKEITNAE